MKINDSDLRSLIELCQAEYLDIGKVELTTEQNPEKALLEKEAFITLSKEVQELIELTKKVPEYIYKENGTLNKIEFSKYLRKRKGWSFRKIAQLKFELWFFLKAMSFSGSWS